MATISVLAKIDADAVAQNLYDTSEKLHGPDGEVVLDFSSVRRIEAASILAMERMAQRAEEKGVRVVLLGVQVEVYKVLKMVKLAPRFSFVN